MILLPKRHAEMVEEAIRAAQAAGELPNFDMPRIEIKPPKNPSMGDYACPVAMALAKPAGMKPLDIATIIAKHMPQSHFLGSVDVAPPGFINFRLNEAWLRAEIDRIIAEGDMLGQLTLGQGKRAQVEFVSANPTGPLTVGRARGAVVGDAMARLLEAAGYSVQREYYFNNAGAQMRKLSESLRIRYLQALGMEVELPSDLYQGEYLADMAKELVSEKGNTLVEEDAAAFKDYAEQKMFENIKQTLARIDIQHDHFFNENSLYENRAIWDVMKQLEERGLTYKSSARETDTHETEKYGLAQKASVEGEATWFRSTQFGDVEDRVLLRSNGEPTYTLPDIAYHIDKLNRKFDLLVNVLGSDHAVEHKVVKYGLQALGLDPSRIHVILMQFVRLVREGQVVRMSTRRGDYETLDDLIDQTSADAVRYILLARSVDSAMDFDLDLAVKQTNENPVYYLQYAYVRCLGILREAQARNFTDDEVDFHLLGEEELAFIRKILTLGDEIEFAATNMQPHVIAFYALDLANLFHPMYDRVRVFGEGVPADVAKARLRFFRAALTVFRRVLKLMGMSTPERM